MFAPEICDRTPLAPSSGGSGLRQAVATDATPLPRVGLAIDAGTVAWIIQTRAAQAGFDGNILGGHSLKRAALNTGMDRNVHLTRLKQLRRHKTYAMLDESLELGDLFEAHPLDSVL